MPEAVLTPFHLTQNDGNITSGNGTASSWSDIWKYQVPQGTGIILQAGDLFAAYLYESTNSAECGGGDCLVKIEVRDSAEQDVTLVYGPGLYTRIKEFQNRNTMARLQVPAPVKVYPRQWIVVAVKDNGAVAYSSSYFSLFTSKVSVPLA